MPDAFRFAGPDRNFHHTLRAQGGRAPCAGRRGRDAEAAYELGALATVSLRAPLALRGGGGFAVENTLRVDDIRWPAIDLARAAVSTGAPLGVALACEYTATVRVLGAVPVSRARAERPSRLSTCVMA